MINDPPNSQYPAFLEHPDALLQCITWGLGFCDEGNTCTPSPCYARRSNQDELETAIVFCGERVAALWPTLRFRWNFITLNHAATQRNVPVGASQRRATNFTEPGNLRNMQYTTELALSNWGRLLLVRTIDKLVCIRRAAESSTEPSLHCLNASAVLALFKCVSIGDS